MVATKVGSGARLELWTEDPDELVIYAPKPGRGLSAYNFELPAPTDEDPLKVVSIPIRTVGPHDGHDPKNPDYNPTFDWRIDPDHVLNVLRYGVLLSGKPVVCRLVDNKKVVVDGRHTVVAYRIANQISKATGGAPANVETRRRKIADDKARIVHVIGNRSYKRQPKAEAEEIVALRDQNGLSLKEIGRLMGFSEQTVRNRLALVEPREEREPGETTPRRGPMTRAELKEAEKNALDIGGPEASLLSYMLLAIRTGKVPEGAPEVVKQVFDGL